MSALTGSPCQRSNLRTPETQRGPAANPFFNRFGQAIPFLAERKEEVHRMVMDKVFSRCVVFCFIAGICLAPAAVVAGDDGAEDTFLERQRRAIERLQSGDAERMISLGELFFSEQVEVDVVESEEGVLIELTSDDPAEAERIQNVVAAALERRDARHQRAQQEREREERIEQIRRLRRGMERLARDMSREERELWRRRIMHMLSDLSDYERERWRERIEQIRQDIGAEEQALLRQLLTGDLDDISGEDLEGLQERWQHRMEQLRDDVSREERELWRGRIGRMREDVGPEEQETWRRRLEESFREQD